MNCHRCVKKPPSAQSFFFFIVIYILPIAALKTRRLLFYLFPKNAHLTFP